MNPVDEKLYNSSYYDSRGKAINSFDSIVSLIISIVNPKSVVDIGCAIGAALSCFRAKGINDILGVDGFWVNEEKLLIEKNEFMRHDFNSGALKLLKRYDLAMSTEVAEHIFKDNSDDFIKTLTDASDIVLFSAAIPGQGGTNHVNEQWPQYWIDKFNKYNYVVLDCIRGSIWKNNAVEFWYKQNLLLFCKEEKVSTLNLPVSTPIYDIIHPEQYIQKLNQLSYMSNQLSLLGNSINSSKITANHEPDRKNTEKELEFSREIMNFLSKTEPLIMQLMNHSIETIVELYEIYKDVIKMESESVAQIEPEFRVALRDRQIKILERIVDSNHHSTT